MAKSSTDHQQRRDELHEKFADLGLVGYWQRQREHHNVEPRLWRWDEVQPALLQAADVISIGPEAFRRNVGLETESRTIIMGYQIVMPGEAAPAHRHTNTALRFVVQGGGAYTTSNGEPMTMQPGDLLIQPNWVWHDHVNDSKEPIIWIDALDVGVVNFLGASRFREEWSEGVQQPLTRKEGASRRLFGPIREPEVRYEGAAGVPYHYKWDETLEALQAVADAGGGDPYDGVLLEYKNPVTGGHTFLTMTCHIQMLLPGQATLPHRHTGTTHYHAVQGQGVTIVDRDEPIELEWDVNDAFTLPPWRWHQFRNASDTEPAILFSVTDRPMLEMTGLDREECE
ncbi:MAG: cupin domain-containing protein [Deltaproteobacteria bacterium]|nr:cupin domain-containing protein [Deltaproteobacteria bacterium]